MFFLPFFGFSQDEGTGRCDWSIGKGILSFILFVFVSVIGGVAVFFFVDKPSEALNMKNPAVLITTVGASTVALLGACFYALRTAGSKAFR